MRRSTNFLGVLIACILFTLLYTVSSEGVPGVGDVDPATPSADDPDQGKKNYVVSVGQLSHAFDPLSVNASIGDTITFKFYPTTHSATLADYSGPCVPWSQRHPEQPDVWSGLITETQVRANPQSWTWRVDTKDPRFFYCSAPQSCTVYGMVFAVNPTSDQTVEKFQSNAYTAHFEISPGQTTPPEGGTSTSTTSKGLSKGAIIGIVIGAIGAVAVVGLLFFLIGRSRKASLEKNAATAPGINVGGDVEPATQPYGDNPPPGYYGHGQVEGWGGKGLAPPVPPLSPANPQYNPHASMYGSPPPPTNPHASWAPSELGGESANQPERVEIYTPGIDDRVPLNNPPTNP